MAPYSTSAPQIDILDVAQAYERVRVSRAFLALGSAAYLVLWWIPSGIEGNHPLEIHLAISATGALVLALSYTSRFVERNLDRFLAGVLYLVTLHLIVYLAINRMSVVYVIALFTVIAAVNAMFTLMFRDRRSLAAYLAFVVLGVVVAALVTGDPLVAPAYVLASVATLAVISFIGVESHMRTRERLVRSERRLRTLETSLPVVLWTVDAEGRLTSLEGRAMSLLGLTPDEGIGQPVGSLFGGDAPVVAATRRALQGAAAPAPLEAQGRVFETWQAPIYDEEGQAHGAIGVGIDITYLRKVEQELRQAQKMEAIGRLAGGIAHDFNNLLTAILGYCELLRARIEEGRPELAEIEEIHRAGQRAAELTEQLLAFSRQRVLEPVRLDLSEEIEGLSRMLQRLIGADIELETRLGADLPPIDSDPGAIEQIVLNLAINARDAMPRGGRLTIETGQTHLAERDAEFDMGAGRYLVLKVRDTGTGMDDETLGRAFEPFFTTKPEGEGTGLGLATVYGIVEQAGGSISVESEPGEGTTFTIYLPCSTPDKPARGPGETRVARTA